MPEKAAAHAQAWTAAPPRAEGRQTPGSAPPAAAGLQWRALQASDRDFLRALFIETRADLIAQLPVTGAARDALIDLQLRAQEQSYRQQSEAAEFLVVTLDTEPVGRLSLGHGPTELQLTDLALLEAWQGTGIGTAILRKVMAQAAALGKDVRLSVAAGNPAERLYRRLGFEQVAADPVYVHMRWAAPRAASLPQPPAADGTTPEASASSAPGAFAPSATVNAEGGPHGAT